VRWLRRGADAGDARAMSSLGFMYQIGHGVQRSDEEAVRWYRKGAEAGYARGQANLGLMYLNGYGIPRDEAQAVRWLRAAADGGDKRASTDLGLLYLVGRGVPQDDAEAFRRLEAGRSETAAEYYLGVLAANQPEFFDQYLKGKGVKPGQLKPGQVAQSHFRIVLGMCTEPPNAPSYRPTGGPRPTRPTTDSTTYRCDPMVDDMGAGQDLGDGTPRSLFDRAATQYFALNREMYPDLYRDKAASSAEALVVILILGGIVGALANGDGATSPDPNVGRDNKMGDDFVCRVGGGTVIPGGCSYPPRPSRQYGARPVK
jgi:TPR repeat protein